jgi:hypothetical protein
MIASFLILALLGVVSVNFWIAWWLVADLFGGSTPAVQAPIVTRVEQRPDRPARPEWIQSQPPFPTSRRSMNQ